MCDELPAGDVALGEIGGALEGLAGFVLKNAIPATCGLAVAATAVFILDHLLIIGIITGATLGVSTVAAIIGARHLLKHHTVIADPRGLTRRPVRRIALEARPAIAIPVKIRPGLPVANPEAVMIAATTRALKAEPAASVVINGTTYSTLRK